MVVLLICQVILLLNVKVHDEREMDRVLGIEGVELIGINNRDLGKASKTTSFYELLIFFL